MSESAKAAYLRLRSEYAADPTFPADEAHERAVKFAHVRSLRAQQAYRKLWEAQQAKAFLAATRRPSDLIALATRYGKPDGLKHLEAAYLAGEVSLEEIEAGIEAAAAMRQRLADEAVQLRHRQTVADAAKPGGYVDLQAGRWVSPDEPPPIVYSHKFTDQDMTDPSEEMEQRSRRAAMHWNLVNGGTPVDDASAAVMGTQYETPRVAIPFMRPTFDQPHGLTGKEADDWKRRAQQDADAAQHEQWEQRRQQLREEDRQLAEARQMDRLRAGSPTLGRGR